MTHEDHLSFVQEPVANLSLLATRAEVMIQVRFNAPNDAACGFVHWNDWISVAKEATTGVIYVLAKRVFRRKQVIAVFCGERIWNSDAAYRNDAPAYEDGVPPSGVYGYVGRLPNGTLGVFDAATCHLFMAAQFIDVTLDPNAANCAIDELGIMYATRRINIGIRLRMLSRQVAQDEE
jgi:hypothetical protein